MLKFHKVNVLNVEVIFFMTVIDAEVVPILAL